jgi:DNA-binding NtrC family response regulator
LRPSLEVEGPGHVGEILIVDPDPSVAESVGRFLERRGHRVVTSARLNSSALRERPAELILANLEPPGEMLALLRELKRLRPPPEVVFLSESDSREKTVDAIRAGANDVLAKPPDLGKLEVVVERALERARLIAQNTQLKERLVEGGSFHGLVGSSAAMRRVYEAVRAVAPHRASVLITGESGTGKELVAQAIHALSARAPKPLIKVNCGVFSETVLESELFGHEKGAFTGAVTQRRGRFELADVGTIFLDEIGEMTFASQVKLLRVLQEGEFERVGGEKTLKTDLRVLAATNIDLAEEVAKKNFREDLFYRLNVVRIDVPALRERREDLAALARHFLAKHGEGELGRPDRLSRRALEALMSYRWPGNVRELENSVQSALVASGRGRILPEHLPPQVTQNSPQAEGIIIPFGATMAEAERLIIAATLERTGGNRTRAARLLDIGVRTIHRKIEEYKL